MKSIYKLAVIILVLGACNDPKKEETSNPDQTKSTPLFTYNVIKVYPHNVSSFTEGLEWKDSILYESTGNYGVSKLARISLSNGNDIQKTELAKTYFGEGITILNGKIYQLTYQEHECFVYDSASFQKLSSFTYEGEGWGMTNDGKDLIMNNGSNNLVYRDAATFKVIKTIPVAEVPLGDRGEEVFINEMEYVAGFIYANVWQTNYIIKIDAATGKVVAKADFSDLVNRYFPNLSRDAVFNGIAYNKKTNTFFITGKHWPNLFEVSFQ